MSQWSYVIRFVDDVAAAISFYRDVVGFKSSLPVARVEHTQLSEQGVRFVRPPTDHHGQRLAEFVTPWGAHTSVSSPGKR